MTGGLGYCGLAASVAATFSLQRRPTARPPHAGPRRPRVAPGAWWQLQLPSLLCQLCSVDTSAFGQSRRQRQHALLAPLVAVSPAPGARDSGDRERHSSPQAWRGEGFAHNLSASSGRSSCGWQRFAISCPLLESPLAGFSHLRSLSVLPFWQKKLVCSPPREAEDALQCPRCLD